MVSAVGSSPTFKLPATATALTAGIEAQIARDQKELANCINCASAETKQGQADIQALSNKISVAKARLEQIVTVNPAGQADAVNSTVTNDATTSISVARETKATDAAAINTTTNGPDATAAKTNDDSDTTLSAPDSGAGRFVNEYV